MPPEGIRTNTLELDNSLILSERNYTLASFDSPAFSVKASRAAGVSFEARQNLLGHKSGRITTHYPEAELSNLIEPANRVCGEKSRTCLAKNDARCHFCRIMHNNAPLMSEICRK